MSRVVLGADQQHRKKEKVVTKAKETKTDDDDDDDRVLMNFLLDTWGKNEVEKVGMGEEVS